MASTATHSLPEDRYEKLSIFALGATVLVALVGAAFAAGWLIGRIVL
jgi:hypothetical protein